MQGPTDRVPMSVSYCFREIEFHILLLNYYAYVNKKSFSVIVIAQQFIGCKSVRSIGGNELTLHVICHKGHREGLASYAKGAESDNYP